MNKCTHFGNFFSTKRLNDRVGGAIDVAAAIFLEQGNLFVERIESTGWGCGWEEGSKPNLGLVR